MTPTVVAAGGSISVKGPAFAGEPAVRILVGPRALVADANAAEVAAGRALPAPDCTYAMTFIAPSDPGQYSVFIVLDPAARLEPPFDITVT